MFTFLSFLHLFIHFFSSRAVSAEKWKNGTRVLEMTIDSAGTPIYNESEKHKKETRNIMILLPQPKKMSVSDRRFPVGANARILLDANCGFAEYDAAKLLKREIERSCGTGAAIDKAAGRSGAAVFFRKTDAEGGAYTLNITETGAEISGGSTGLFYGMQTMRQIVRRYGGSWPLLAIEDEPSYPERGFFYDVTRGMVPTLQTLKDLADRLAFYKINQLQLYVEHTFAFRGFSEAWTGKDPLSAEEILELDEYCRNLRIELVPSIATFGHLYEILVTKTWNRFSELNTDAPFAWYDRMAHHTLNVSDENSFSIVKQMLDQYLPLFSSRQFNICCDETFDIGKGKSAALAQEKGVGRLYVDFLKKITAYVQQHGKKVLFWSDIILKSPEYLSEIPKNTECLFWDYSPRVKEDGVKTIAQSGVEFGVCPGVCGWNMMMNLFENSYLNISKLVRYGLKYGAHSVLNTDWGDFGHINLFANSMPGMAMGADLSWNPDDKRDARELLETYFTLEFGEHASELTDLLLRLSHMQAGTWANVVCWHEYRVVKNNGNAENDKKQFTAMNDAKLLDGFRGALEIEKDLAALSCPEHRRQDMREFVCSARGVAMMDAACLALRKYAFGFADAPLAFGCRDLAEQLEYWFADYETVWRARGRESELYRIRTTVQDLCAFLRSAPEQ